MTASPSGSVTEMEVSGSPSTDFTLSGYQASLSFHLRLASTGPPYNTTCTTWSSHSPTSWAGLRQMPSYPSRSTISLNASKVMQRNQPRSWDFTGWLLTCQFHSSFLRGLLRSEQAGALGWRRSSQSLRMGVLFY